MTRTAAASMAGPDNAVQRKNAVRASARPTGRGQQDRIEADAVVQALAQSPGARQLIDAVDIGLHRSEIRFGGAGTGETDYDFLDQQPRLGQIIERDAAETRHVLQRLAEARGAFEDEGAALYAVLQSQQAGDFQAAQRLAHCGLAGAELLGELAFRGDLRLPDASSARTRSQISSKTRRALIG